MLRKLNRFICVNFDQADIENLNFSTGAGVSQDFGPDLQSQAMGFVTYFDEQGTLPDFVTACQMMKPDLDWGDLPNWVQIYAQFRDKLTDEEILEIGELLHLSLFSSNNLSQEFFEQVSNLDFDQLVWACDLVRPDVNWGQMTAFAPEVSGIETLTGIWEAVEPLTDDREEMDSGSPPAPPGQPTLSQLRLDVAVPAEVETKRPFVLAVAIRQSESPILSEKNLDQVDSDDFEVEWPEDQNDLDLMVEISAPECQITSASQSPVRLRRDQDSPVLRFHLIPNVTGSISIIVTVFQDSYPLGSTWLESMATVNPVAQVETTVQSQSLTDGSKMEQIFDQIYSTFMIDELKTVAFRLNIDYEEFVTDTKSGTIRELILFCQRRKLINKLLETCQLFRPQFDWSLA